MRASVGGWAESGPLLPSDDAGRHIEKKPLRAIAPNDVRSGKDSGQFVSFFGETSMNRHLVTLILCPGILPLAAHAETTLRRNGTDSFVAGPSLPLDTEAPGDLFVVGNGVTLRGPTRGDAHVAGFDLDVEAPVGGDLYAAGANVELDAPVGRSATIAGWSVRLSESGTVAGNARLAGGTVALEAPVAEP